MLESESWGWDADPRREGEIMRKPSDDELIRPVPKEISAAHSILPDLGPHWYNGQGGNQDGTRPNPSTPKRKGATLAVPGPQRQKLDGDADKESEDRDLSDRRCLGAPEADMVVTITAEDVARTGKHPALGWPEYPEIISDEAADHHLAAPHLPYGQFTLVGPQGWMD